MSYTVHQAKTQFSRLLREVEAGKEVIVTRGKKPVAKLVPIALPAEKDHPFRYIGAFAGLVEADDHAFDPMTDEELVETGFGLMLEGELERPSGPK
jgi:prevent-host-death family protein